MSRITDSESPLRRARTHRNWTLDDAVGAIDAASTNGASGVTPSQLSGWERGKVKTSAKNRALLCKVYGQPPELLFAHQDAIDPDTSLTLVDVRRVVRPHRALLAAMIEVVIGARELLVVTGSRSRDPAYLSTIVKVLVERPELVHYRVLFGPPRHQILKDHLVELLTVRDPADRTHGGQTLNIGVVDEEDVPERFFVASENCAVVPIPSLTTADGFDTGLVFGPDAARGLIAHGREAYASSRRIVSREDAARLTVL